MVFDIHHENMPTKAIFRGREKQTQALERKKGQAVRLAFPLQATFGFLRELDAAPTVHLLLVSDGC
jgi:hypothetical protein